MSESTLPPVAPERQSEEPLWGIPEVATFLNVSRNTVRRLATRGELPHTRVGGQLRFVPATIRELVGAQPAA